MIARKLIVLLALVPLVMAVGCGDDESGSTGGDDADSGGDAGGDMLPDTEPDMLPDIADEPDVADEPDAVVEPDVTDEPDVGFDVEVDMGGSSPIVDACEDVECTDPDVCVGGACVAPIEADDWVADAAGRPASWLSEIQFPSEFASPNQAFQDCCFDYNGDDQTDNALSLLLDIVSALQPGLDLTEQVNVGIEADEITLLLSWTNLPEGDGDAAFALVLGSNDVDGNDEPDETYNNRLDGSDFLVNPDSLDTHGPQVQFNNGTRTGNLITAGPSTFPLALDIPVLGFIQATLRFALIEFDLNNASPNPPSSATEILAEGDGPFYDHVGGVRIGGLVELAEIAAVVDAQVQGGGEIAGCGCAFQAQVVPVDFAVTVVDDEDEGIAVLECAGSTQPVPAANNSCTEGTLCDSLGVICAQASLLAAGDVPDVDTDDDGIRDSISVGLYGSAVGVTIIDPNAVE